MSDLKSSIFSPHPQIELLYTWGELDIDFSIHPDVYELIAKSYQNLQMHLQQKRKVYGIHTHFGAQVDQPCELTAYEHQKNLLEYLQVGVGTPVKETIVRRALRLQIHKISLGYSAIHLETVLELMAYAKTTPLAKVFRHGSLGASGDLIPMAHAVAPIFKDKIQGPRDVLGLVNTNAMMASVAIEYWMEFYNLFLETLQIVSKMIAVMNCSWDFFQLPQRMPFAKQRPAVAQVSQAIENQLLNLGIAPPITTSLQPRYSLRCSPQILGAIWTEISTAQAWILEEALAISDNPIIDEQSVWHAGLFYASLLGSSADLIQSGIGKLAELLDRQVLLLMDPQLNGGLSSNLWVEGKSHCKGIHQLISALNQRLRAMGEPVRKMSFSCESNNQDVVPCSMEAWNMINDMLFSFRDVVKAAQFCVDRAWHIRYSTNKCEDLKIFNQSSF
jgi:histidine ammonia-lyase